ncbi:leucine-rich repeat domain-containing protein, partial [Ruminococcus albus]
MKNKRLISGVMAASMVFSSAVPTFCGNIILPFSAVTASALTTEDGNFKYEIDGDSIKITTYLGSASKVTIPSVIDGKEVTTIGSYMFMLNSSLREVVIPDTVEEIQSSAFQSSGLKSIVIPSSVETIGSGAFEYCSKLESITINSGVNTIENNAFQDCVMLEEITLPDSVKTLGNAAFNGCKALTSVKLS